MWNGVPAGTVISLRRLQSPQGLQLPDGLRTICSGEAHGLDDRRMMPIDSILRNSALAAESLSGERRRARECTGGPFVIKKCSMPCLGMKRTKFGVEISGNLASRLL